MITKDDILLVLDPKFPAPRTLVNAVSRRLGCTPAEIADAIGVTAETMQRWRSGRHRMPTAAALLLAELYAPDHVHTIRENLKALHERRSQQ